MPAESVSHVAYPSLTIEEGADFLRCQAATPPVGRLVIVGGVLLAGLGYMNVNSISWLVDALKRDGRGDLAEAWTQVILCLMLLLATSGVIVLALRRYRQPRRLTIENGLIHVLTPEQIPPEHALACADVRAAELGGGREVVPGSSSLALLLKRGGTVRAFVGLPERDLAVVVDAVNRFVRIDNFHAFEVLARPGNADAHAAPLAAIPVARAGEPMPPLAVLPVEARDRALPVDHWQQ
ncbi:MAG TPA: hypothetical protein VF624_15915 [Tepidisphaeraceae bacterium]